MALNKAILTEYGIEATYWRLFVSGYSHSGKIASVKMLGYVNDKISKDSKTKHLVEISYEFSPRMKLAVKNKFDEERLKFNNDYDKRHEELLNQYLDTQNKNNEIDEWNMKNPTEEPLPHLDLPVLPDEKYEPPFDEADVDYSFDPNQPLITQLYDRIKRMPEFADAKDV